MANLLDIVGYFRRYWPVAAFNMVAASAFEVIDLAVPYAIGQILNVLSGQPLDGLMQGLVGSVATALGQPVGQGLTLAVMLGIVFVSTVVKAPIQPWLGHWLEWDVTFRARRDHYTAAHAKLLTLPLEFFDENNSGRIAGVVARGISNHTWTYPEVVGQMVPKLVRVMAITAIIWVVDWRIGLAFLVSFGLILGLIWAKLLKLTQIEEKLDRYTEQTESRTSEIITNIKTVKAFATEGYELGRQRQRLDREFQILNYRIHLGYVRLNVTRTTIVQTCMFFVLASALWATLQGSISVGHFIMVLTVSSMAYSEVTPLGNLAEVFSRRYASMIKLHEFLLRPAGRDAASLNLTRNVLPLPKSGRDLSVCKFTGKLEFDHLSFGYDPSRLVLEDFHLLIQPCQTVALVGRSGSGKSTLVKLLFRYFDPTGGQIRIDGQNIRELDITRYRQRLAIVHQEVDVFNGTILENLTYGSPQATPDQVQAACRIARVEEFIQQLPKGYGTVVGERGIRLSGGQRQRLGIARALIRDPDVLVFDEATSSLDYESERAIQIAMRRIQGTRTTIIIAHRLSTIREADVIVVLDRGRILEVGSHAELLTRSGLYSRLHALQESGELLA